MKVDPSEITPKRVYMNRRRFMAGASALTLGALVASCARSGGEQTPTGAPTPVTPDLESYEGLTDELGDPLSDFDVVSTYNNYYEFSLSKTQVVKLVGDFETSPWQVEVGGLVRNPKTYDTEDLLEFEQEERIYRLRCVEAWSMVVPWVGFPLRKLLEEAEPASEAQYVRFETVYRPDQMPGQKMRSYPWPYVEGLRLDEAMHDLTLLATGIYGEPLLPQNGAPIRLVVPWKYGFKYAKSIVKIDLVREMPISLWMKLLPQEYGFYGNVNPNVPHPRWSQATERRIGEGGRRETLMFNGYGEEVAHLYEGMDLIVNY